MAQLTYGDSDAYAIDTAMLPEGALVALAQRTYNHIMGNEAASALKSKRDNGGLPDNQTEDTFLHEWRATKRQQIVDGKLGVRTGGPRVDPLTKEFNHQIELRVNQVFKDQGRKIPKDRDEEFQFGDQTRTWNVMFANAKASPLHAEPAMAAAKQIVAARKRAEDAAAKQTKGAINLAEAGF